MINLIPSYLPLEVKVKAHEQQAAHSPMTMYEEAKKGHGQEKGGPSA